PVRADRAEHAGARARAARSRLGPPLRDDHHARRRAPAARDRRRGGAGSSRPPPSGGGSQACLTSPHADLDRTTRHDIPHHRPGRTRAMNTPVFANSEQMRMLLYDLTYSSPGGGWRADPRATELMRFAMDKYAGLARKHG